MKAPQEPLTAGEALRAGKRIREMRRHLGLKQWELGNKAGIAQSAICHAERADALATRSSVTAIAWALGLTLEELLSECRRCEGTPRPWTLCLACGAEGATP